MRPFTRSIIELFDGKRRYLIPLYQRQYAWRVDPDLELLWDDISRAADRLEAGGVTAAPHFMGAIVIAQIATFGRQVQAYEVIDGQQRLTTFQLLLAAFRDVAQAYGSEYRNEVEKYLFNDGVMDRGEIERFKLWPSLIDRPAFTAMITGVQSDAEQNAEGGFVRPAVAAQAFFKDRIERRVLDAATIDPFRMEKLFEALRLGLAVVSIELEAGDDAQTIFETLNSRGVELSAADLMRNFIFQRAKGLGQVEGSLEVDRLYETYWLPLDAVFWRLEDTRGRQTKTRLDWLLVDHLAMKKADLVSADKLFDGYRRWIVAEAPYASVEAELQAIAASAAVHRRLAEMNPDDPLGEFGRFARAFDVSTAMPLVLFLTAECRFGGAELVEMLKMIQSFIVRRDICGLPTGSYNRTFVEMIATLRRVGTVDAAALSRALSTSQADIARWPSDEEWQIGWLGRDQYRANRQTRLRYILEAIEHRRRAGDSEIVAIKSDLTVEHIMPQKWRQHWPVPGFDHLAADDVDVDQMAREIQRDEAVNKMGNLTLLTGKLNTQVSNGPFATKLPAVKAHAALTINRDLHAYDRWDETTIVTRGKALFDVARQVWPAPSGAGDQTISNSPAAPIPPAVHIVTTT